MGESAISLSELKKVLPASSFFTIKFTGKFNSKRQDNAGRRKVLKWSKKELTCLRCVSNEETYIAINDDFRAFWRGKLLVFAYGEEEFVEISDIQTGAGYAKKEVATWEGKVSKI